MKEITNIDDRLIGADTKVGEYKAKIDEMKKQVVAIKEKLAVFNVHLQRIDDIKAFADMTGKKLDKEETKNHFD